ncbi:MAG: electron transport complex subunit E [Candidatus Cloacimonetes bacterium]|nr:electron transport complex subunit E [Candidatus Cloacimonadota bacterium]MCF7813228.1 electron transport complex subunit E [Candidatus Cloacimonadota bacterium]MCF7867427.1 electron transport complex subunit E [Candidatus Cloacimonadota bacterium]MCF7882941.1 electron transport complex subunit E [Candidatus Cloacimonadota bacterium]
MIKEFTKGFIKENPVFVMALGLCPTLAVSSSVMNAIGMGLAATFVLVCSNIIISLIKNFIPNKIRIPAYIVVIASFVTIVDMVMEAYVPALHKSLGLFIPLIVVNCIILGRAEAFAGKNGVFKSFLDGLGMGLGFALALIVIATIREILGAGQFLGMNVLPATYKPMLVAILAPGAFIVMGLLMGAMNLKKKK